MNRGWAGFRIGGSMLRRNWAGKRWAMILVFGCALAGFSLTPAAAQQQAESKNINLFGHDYLQGRSTYQPVVHKQGNRWIACIGHYGGSSMNTLTGKVEDNGTSI